MGFLPTLSVNMPPGISANMREIPKDDITTPTRVYEISKEEAYRGRMGLTRFMPKEAQN
jgi:hypothetical protein